MSRNTAPAHFGIAIALPLTPQQNDLKTYLEAVLDRRRWSVDTVEDIYVRVARVLAETLNADEDDLTPTATLQGDLGAESIDFLDIVFRLEREFGIDIPNDELFPESIFHGSPDVVREGRVTDQGIHELRSRMPYADLGNFDRDRRLSTIADLFTVGLVARYITWKLGQGSGARANGSGGVPLALNPSPAHQR